MGGAPRQKRGTKSGGGEKIGIGKRGRAPKYKCFTFDYGVNKIFFACPVSKPKALLWGPPERSGVLLKISPNFFVKAAPSFAQVVNNQLLLLKTRRLKLQARRVPITSQISEANCVWYPDIMLKKSNYVKIVIAVPVKSADKVRQTLGKAGAGIQGNYEFCSGSYQQIGRFKPITGAQPSIGQIGRLEEVEEEVIEAICHKDLIKKVISAVKKVHPYEEPAIDIYPRLEIE